MARIRHELSKRSKPNTGYLLDPTQYLAPGLLKPGNINLGHRPAIRNRDGTVSSVRSASFATNGRAVLLPTVVWKNGRGVNVRGMAAWRQYQRTGRHLGIFKTEKQANSYAEMLHQRQDAKVKN